MADARDQGESSHGLRDTIEKYKGKAKRFSKSERKAFESEKEAFESDKKVFESDKEAFEYEKTLFNLREVDFALQKSVFEIIRNKQANREVVTKSKEEFIKGMEEDFLCFVRHTMYLLGLSELEVESRMEGVETKLSSFSVRSDHSNQFYSNWEEPECPPFSLTEVALLPSANKEFE
ncbi:hypothetical protein THARTR1_02582 [Trichoderma harzianum]|uniref:Uncharacterized protein n=1 Tax=Trichoderma harzianum TaxID=5544 RepID=A0A2K0UIJ6_TRIHA|nr:hypothetical protein THARTR1_02582 [Trichoderma harzianum]